MTVAFSEYFSCLLYYAVYSVVCNVMATTKILGSLRSK